MRVVFMGTPLFAVPILESLASSHDVVAVYTQPDRPAGRGRGLTSSAVKQRAEALGLRVLQPHSLRAAGDASALAALVPDVVCVVAYGLLLPPDVLSVPAYGCLNVHASLLPRWRGAAPIERAILAGDAVTGVSIMRMEEGLDTGPYALQVRVEIGEMYLDDLRESLASAGMDALCEVLRSMQSDTVAWTAQDERTATYARKVTSADVSLGPSAGVDDLVRQVRASSRSAPSRAIVECEGITVLRACRAGSAPGVGRVAVVDGTPVLGASDGGLLLESVVPAGRRRMTGAEYARGRRFAADAAWEAPR
jgi:methionyl-tRNA formyltransferase